MAEREPATAGVAPIPAGLAAPGTGDAPFRAAASLADLPPGALRRVTFGDLDLLLAHLPVGLIATEDRCPHMAAPLSLGDLDGCVVDCPLHAGRFDLATGEPVQLPTTGGLGADGTIHPVWAPPGAPPKADPPGRKSEARRLTRIRRLRFYPLRVRDGVIEIGVPSPGSEVRMDMQAINRRVIEQFRAGGPVEGMHRERLLLLTTTGARSGLPRTTPMMVVRDGERLVVIASNKGAADDPQWYRNLVADPRAIAELADATLAVRAVTLAGAERERVWTALVAAHPFFAEHQARVARTIPVVVLEPTGPEA